MHTFIPGIMKIKRKMLFYMLLSSVVSKLKTSIVSATIVTPFAPHGCCVKIEINSGPKPV